MELRIMEKRKDKLKVEVVGESHTLLNLMRENAWKEKAEQASYMIEHPYLSQPKIIVRAKNPKSVLVNAAQMIVDDAKEFSREFKRAAKK
jgi:DNA-directed RNA polymerase subunit L